MEEEELYYDDPNDRVQTIWHGFDKNDSSMTRHALVSYVDTPAGRTYLIGVNGLSAQVTPEDIRKLNRLLTMHLNGVP